MSEIEPVKSNAAQAFESLRGEVALLRRAVEALAAERRETPDYRPSIEALSVRQQQLVEATRKLAGAAVLVMTPEQVAAKLGDGVRTIGAVQADALREVLAKLQGTAEQLGVRAKHVRDAEAQTWWLAGATIAGWVCGMMCAVALIRLVH
jgi:hypothetical protein